MLTDHIIMGMICIPVAIILFPTTTKGGFYFILVPYLNKDFLQSRSPAKRLLGLQLQDMNGAPANELRAFLRNVTCILWPIEVLLIAAGSRKRLGDYIAGTQVVASKQSKHSWYQDLLAYQINACTFYTLLATIFYLLLLHGLFMWLGL
jgi:uncharacterized RDD family membrane protein YckC